MFSRLYLSLFFIFCVLWNSSGHSADEEIEFLLSPIPPLVMNDEENSSGLLWDMSHELFSRLKSKHSLSLKFTHRVLPWNRAFREITIQKNKIMLQMGRSQEREGLFEWIEPTTKLSFAFVRKEAPAINSLEEGLKARSIAVYRGSSLETFLRSKGFEKNLNLTNNSLVSARLLNADRVDAWYASVQEALWLHKSGVMKSRPFIGEEILAFPIWAVASKETSPKIIKIIGEEIKAMKKDGTLDRLKHKYGLTG